MSLDCVQAGNCSGCTWIQTPYHNQLEAKRSALAGHWQEQGLPLLDLGEPEIISVGTGALRDRADMTLHRESGLTHLGLYDRERETILDIAECPQMTPALASWFGDFRTLKPAIQFGHLRLRVAPDGTRGIWLDFPNQLLEELIRDGAWLSALADVARVELSQRRNSLIKDASGLRAGPAQLFPWFETYADNQRAAIPLFCTVGSFTQAGFQANRELVQMVRKATRDSGVSDWLELGAGIGNFSLALVANGARICALENDRRATAGLQYGANQAGLAEKLDIRVINIHRRDDHLAPLVSGYGGILADPPRSGLRGFLTMLAGVPPVSRPGYFVYVSCFAQTLASDCAELYRLGYRLERLQGLDQFPQSPHCEWLATLRYSP